MLPKLLPSRAFHFWHKVEQLVSTLVIVRSKGTNPAGSLRRRVAEIATAPHRLWPLGDRCRCRGSLFHLRGKRNCGCGKRGGQGGGGMISMEGSSGRMEARSAVAGGRQRAAAGCHVRRTRMLCGRGPGSLSSYSQFSPCTLHVPP